jgi:hypothetical protein
LFVSIGPAAAELYSCKVCVYIFIYEIRINGVSNFPRILYGGSDFGV